MLVSDQNEVDTFSGNFSRRDYFRVLYRDDWHIIIGARLVPSYINSEWVGMVTFLFLACSTLFLNFRGNYDGVYRKLSWISGSQMMGCYSRRLFVVAAKTSEFEP